MLLGLSLKLPAVMAGAGHSSARINPPAPDRFIRDRDPAFQQHFLNEPQAQWKPVVEPNGMGDDLRWETVTFVAVGRLGHAVSSSPEILTPSLCDNTPTYQPLTFSNGL